MPDYLDEFGREKWDQLINDMTNMRVISSEMRELMIAYCEAYSGWRKCLALVRRIGPTIMERDDDGNVTIKKNHLSVELHKYREQMNKLLPEFGLTPASRSKLVSFNELGQDDPFTILLERMTGPN